MLISKRKQNSPIDPICGRVTIMPGEHIVLNNGQLVLHKLSGALSHQEILGEARRVYEDRSIRVGAVQVVDARQASLPETPIEKINEVADVYANFAKTGLFSKIAIVAPSAEEEFKKSVRFESLMARHGVNLISFANLDVACTWIGCDSQWIEDRFDSMRPS